MSWNIQKPSEYINGPLTVTGDLNVRSAKLAVTSLGVGFGTGTPQFPLDCVGVSRFYSTGDGIFLSGYSSPDLYSIGVNYYNNAGTEAVVVSTRPSWRLEHKNGADVNAYFDIGYRAANAAASAFSSRFKIDGYGNVGVGVAPALNKGCLQLASGINFPATQVANADANTLDDYEEGSWTPVVTAATGTLTTVSSQLGYYTKVGRLVTAHCYFVVTANGTGGSSIQVSGLPFASSNAFNITGCVRLDGVTGELGQIKFAAGGTGFNVWKYNNTYPAADGTQFPCVVTYFV